MSLRAAGEAAQRPIPEWTLRGFGLRPRNDIFIVGVVPSGLSRLLRK